MWRVGLEMRVVEEEVMEDGTVLICSRFCRFLLVFFSVCYSVIYEFITSGYKLLAFVSRWLRKL